MPTPAATEPPTPDNIHLYRAAAVAYRKEVHVELQRNAGNRMLVNWHVPLHAAALAVKELAPEMDLEQARTFAQRACAWTAQAHNDWFWKERD